MRCSKCGAENREGARFCEECGANLSTKCPSCGAEYRPYAKFCDSCGAVLGGGASPAETKPKQPPRTERDAEGLEGERRHLSVVFCDLVDSTGLSHRLDPEESRAIVLPYQRAAAGVVEQFGGHVAKFLGDGVMALFGWPVAHEDDAERAIRAALSILEAISALNQQSEGSQLSTRIGIHTGTAVLAAGGDSAPDVFGDVSNLASRAQNEADPNTVVITASTQQVVAGRFVVEALGEKRLKGIDEPLELFRVIRPSGAQRHLATASARGLTPFVGREDEMRALMSRWELARKGEGQVVLILGEAGIGKSRLVQQFREGVSATQHSWIQTEFSPYLQNTPFASIADMIQQALGWSGEVSVEAKLAQLEQNLETVGLKAAEAVPLIASLLNLPVSEKYPPLQLSPEQQRKLLLAVLTDWIFGMARVQPLVMVLEDLHWSDPSTLELHQIYVERGATVPLLLVYTARPEFRAPWPMYAHHTQIALGRLRERDVREMVHAVAAKTTLTEPMVDAIAKRSSGVPLFVEELARAVVEGGGQGPTSDIPGTLHNSLIARLDRLGSAKEAAQVASVIGREFSYQLLSSISPMGEAELQSSLMKLADADLIYARGIAPDASYIFKHALIRDAAYEGLLKTRRRELHSRITNTIEQSFPDLAAAHPELLAHHYTEAGSNEQAVRYWQRAGQQAVEHSAHVEAISHLNRGLELLKTLPSTPEHAAQELTVQITLGVPIGITKGYASAEGQAVYERARALCEQIGDTQQLYPVLWALWRLHHVRAEYQQACKLGEELLLLAQHNQNREFLLQAYHSLWTTLVVLGEFAVAKGHLDQALEIYDPQLHHSHTFLYGGHDPGVCCRSHRSLVLWYLGYPDQALKSAQETIALAQKLSHPYSLAAVSEALAMISQFCRNFRETVERADTAIAMAREHGFSVIGALGTLDRGWALAEQGNEAEGLSEMHRGLTAYRASGAGTGLPYQLARFAEVYSRTGQIQEGLNSLTEAMALTAKTGDRRWLAELHRLKGVLTLQSPRGLQHEAEESLQRAISIARGQQAKSLELRATTSLARLLRGTNRHAEARAMLAEIYNWFTEGFDTADLKDAKALLQELNN